MTLPSTIVTLDFETFYDAEYTLKRMTTEAYVRDARFEGIGVGVKINDGPAEWMPVDRLRGLLDWQSVAVLAHHAQFDGLILSHHFGIRPAFWFCTLSMARALHGTDVGNSLGKLLEWYALGEKGDEVERAKGKRLADFTPDELAAYGAYCCNDVEGAYALLCTMLARGFPESELHIIDSTVRMFTEPRLLIDRSKLADYITDERARKMALLARLGTSAKELGSNEKLAEIFRLLGVEPPMKTSPATGLPIFAFAKSDAGMQALLEDPRDDVRRVAEARLEVKSTINETRAARLHAVGGRGPLPVYLKYYGAHTGRASGGDKLNLQNLTRGGVLRDALLALFGWLIVAIDSNAIEARMLAWLAGCAAIADAFAEGRDVYSEFASLIYRRPVDRKSKDPATKARDAVPGFVGKTAILGLGYGMGWFKFSTALANAATPVVFTQADAVTMDVNVPAFASLHGERALEAAHRISDDAWLVHCAVVHSIVGTYRRTNSEIPALWHAMEDLLPAMVRGDEVHLGPIYTEREALVLPNGMRLRYPGLTLTDDGYTYQGGRAGKERVKVYGGSLTENVVQALARIVVFGQMMTLQEKYGYRAAMSTHDETVLIVPEAEAPMALARGVEEMCVAPEWARGCPLFAEGGYGKNYGEAK